MNLRIKTIMTFMIMISLIVLPVQAISKQEILKVVESYYSTFAAEDMQAYIDTQFTWHLSEQEYKEKVYAIQNIWDSIDVLSYDIDRFEISGLEGDTAIVTYVLSTKIGEVKEVPETYEFTKSFTAILTTADDRWKVFQVMPTELFDLQMNLYDLITPILDAEPAAPEPSIGQKIWGFIKRMPELFIPPPDTCGNRVCDNGESTKNCAEDCTMLSFQAECGNGICSEGEDYASCPYDCEKSEEKPEIQDPAGEDLTEIPSQEPDEDKNKDTQTEQEPEDKISEPECTADNECDDAKACTSDSCSEGSCLNEPIETCINSDGCCPRRCNTLTDNDCQPKCGNGLCEEGETCECWQDCKCSKGVCIKGKCTTEAVCEDDDGCDDRDSCTEDICNNAGSLSAYCTNEAIDDCTEEEETPASTGGSTTSGAWKTGTATLPTLLDGDHAFFDFNEGKITSDYNKGDIMFNSWGDLMGECESGGSTCTGIKKESALSFNNMENPPTSSYDGAAQPSSGDKYWIKTVDARYGKIEITSMKKDAGDNYESLTFRWGFLE